MKLKTQIAVLLLPSGWDASASQGFPAFLFGFLTGVRPFNYIPDGDRECGVIGYFLSN